MSERTLVAAHIFVLAGCSKQPLDAHVAAVCEEGLGSAKRETKQSHAHPCDMTQGQVKQWLSDNATTTDKDWLKLVSNADTLNRLTMLWSCRHDDGSSNHDWGYSLAAYGPTGHCFQVLEKKWLEATFHRQLTFYEKLRTYGVELGPPVNGSCVPPSWIDARDKENGQLKLIREGDPEGPIIFEGRSLDCPEWPEKAPPADRTP